MVRFAALVALLAVTGCSAFQRDTFVEMKVASAPTAVRCTALSTARHISYGEQRVDQREGAEYRAYIFEGAAGDEVEIRVSNAGRLGERPYVLVLGQPTSGDVFPVLTPISGQEMASDTVVRTRLEGPVATFAVGGASAFRIEVSRPGA